MSPYILHPPRSPAEHSACGLPHWLSWGDFSLALLLEAWGPLRIAANSALSQEGDLAF